MSGWELVYEDYIPEQEGLREALCTVGNGYFATRGAGCETRADGIHYPGTYLAGGYNRVQSDVAGRTIENEDLVNMPNWLPLSFAVDDGQWFDLDSMEVLSYKQKLDLSSGQLHRSVRVRDAHGRTSSVDERRLISMHQMHVCALQLTVRPEDWSGSVRVRTSLDGTVLNEGVERYSRLNSHHLEPRSRGTFDHDCMFLEVETSQSGLRVAEAARTQAFVSGHPREPERYQITQPGRVTQEFCLEVEPYEELRLEKIVALFTSRDRAIAECALEARKVVAVVPGFEELAAAQAVAWGHLWDRFDIDLSLTRPDDTRRTLLILRLHLFHLLQTCSAFTMDLDAGIPARGWHGEAYRGHIFWDEVFIFPILNLRLPEITRSLLLYRYRRLDEARRSASAAGFRGAMYPWQSGSNGREESQRLHLNPRSGEWITDNTALQRHVNAIIAFNAWQYHQVTGDTQFLVFYGAEMMLEIARFWASASSYDERDDRYGILGVVGPDEYHDGYPDAKKPGLDNNAYTNVMASWCLCRALDVLELIPPDRARELCETLDLEDDELELWDRISRRLKVPFQDDEIISQFEGYDSLPEFDWDGYRTKYEDIHRLDRILDAEGDSVNRYKASKQADVLMLFYLLSADELRALLDRLGYSLSPDAIPRNIDYYLKRTSHGSTLSRVVHSWVLSRSERGRSWTLFKDALESDVNDVQGGTTPEGIHLGAMAGTVDLVQRCYTGIETRGDALFLNPRLPEDCRHLRLHLRYRGHSLRVEVDETELKISNLSYRMGKIEIVLPARTYEVASGESIVHTLGS